VVREMAIVRAHRTARHTPHAPAAPGSQAGQGSIAVAMPSAGSATSSTKSTSRRIRTLLTPTPLYRASTVAEGDTSETGRATSGASLNTPMGDVRQAVTGSVLVLTLLLVSCQAAETRRDRPESVPRIGELAPAFALPSAEGGQVSVRDFQGRSAVLLYFSMGPG
jgi:hypothetical protein